MSWRIEATGTVDEVRKQCVEQFKLPAANKEVGYEGEVETAKLISQTIDQVLSTFDPSIKVTVSAVGTMSFKKLASAPPPAPPTAPVAGQPVVPAPAPKGTPNVGAFQEVTLSIKPQVVK